jgi:hypothetical protein
MKRPKRRLDLNATTIRLLSVPDLREAVGGVAKTDRGSECWPDPPVAPEPTK